MNIQTTAEHLFEQLAPEARALLKSRPISIQLCRHLARLKPVRQAEAAQLMVASGVFTAEYVRILVCATERSLLASPKAQPRRAVDERKRNAASTEIGDLARQLRVLSDIRPSDLLTLRAYCRYVVKLLQNNRTRKHLEQRWPELCHHLREVVQRYWDSEFLQFGHKNPSRTE